jgi:lanthanide-dependent methanol dehydrogenase
VIDPKDADRRQSNYLGINVFLALTIVCVACKQGGTVQRTFPFLQRYSAAPAARTNLIDMQKDDGQWVMPAKNYQSTRFSALNQINAGNVKDLKVAWTFSMANERGEEAAPLVVNNTMYVVSPFPNTLYALDLTQPGAPAKW